MKTLCLDARMLYSSGIGTYIQNLLPYFEEHYKLILLGDEKEISSVGLRNAEIIPFHLPIYSIKEQVVVPFKVPVCDIYWSPHYNAPIFPVRSKKRIVTIHDAFHLHYYDNLRLLQKIYVNLFLKLSAKMADTVLTVSHFSKKELIRYLHIPGSKIHVIHNGVSSKFRILENQRELSSVRNKYQLPDKFILFVGNVKPHKNIINLIQAYELLKLKNPLFEYKLVIAGKRKGFITPAENLDQFIRSKGLGSDVLFAENIESHEMPAIYNLASVLVFPSFYEGFGLPPLEAMNCGCPTVVSDIDSLKEIYGNESIYISPFQPESIQKGITTVLTDQSFREDLIRRGIEHSKKYTWISSANKHLHIFEETLRK